MEVIKIMPALTSAALSNLNAWQDQLVIIGCCKVTANQRIAATVEIVAGHRPVTPSEKHYVILAAIDCADVAVRMDVLKRSYERK